ncbi:hypothetical protein L1049_022553 [Liquidambar formosana]|uniref:Uncharacterized protein n=1 Tax=Liquidambar formosana TaxID=63359 RepID=A0AAP0WQD1_LIQFO
MRMSMASESLRSLEATLEPPCEATWMRNPDLMGCHSTRKRPLRTYVNSNFQAINNSIMLGGSYSTNDPGVHMDISDFFEHNGHKPDKHGKKGKKKEKETSKSDQHSEHSDN